MPVSLTLRDITSRDLSVKESPVYQTEGEQIVYALTTTNIGSSPSSITVTAKNLSSGGQNVTANVLSGSASVSSDVITLPTILNLVKREIYQIKIQFTLSGIATPLVRYLRIITV